MSLLSLSSEYYLIIIVFFPPHHRFQCLLVQLDRRIHFCCGKKQHKNYHRNHFYLGCVCIVCYWCLAHIHWSLRNYLNDFNPLVFFEACFINKPIVILVTFHVALKRMHNDLLGTVLCVPVKWELKILLFRSFVHVMIFPCLKNISILEMYSSFKQLLWDIFSLSFSLCIYFEVVIGCM